MNKKENSLCRILGVIGFLGFGLLTLLIVGKGFAAPNATYIVNSSDDSDDGTCNGVHCSLREAINTANSTAGADTISFTLNPSTTITLAGSQLPTITDTLTIDGSTAQSLRISGADMSRIFQIGSSTAVTLTNLIIYDGRSFVGGAIYNDGDVLNIIESTIKSSLAEFIKGGHGSGGGIFNRGKMNIIRSTINSNSCYGYHNYCLGGGVANVGTLNVTNSTISGNRASGLPFYGGGGIGNMGILTIINSTIDGNEGGGIDHTGYGVLNFINTIISNTDNGADCYSSNIGTNVNNLVEDGSCSPAFTGDPLLRPLEDNGGPTWTRALSSISLAVDNGDESTCAAPPINNLDQRGVTRPLDGNGDGIARCDIGAYEYDGPPPYRVYLPLLRKN